MARDAFWTDRDEGVFGDPVAQSAGDPDAADDLERDALLPPLQFMVGPDGIPMPAGFVPAANDRNAVHEGTLLCLAGCRHYVEAVCDLEPGSPERVTLRYCRLLRTWAELMDLAEADVWACSGYEPSAPPTDEASYSAIQRNAEVLDGLHENRSAAYRAICESGPCEHYVELLAQGPNDDEPQTRRFCIALAGAARAFDLCERLVRGCSCWQPRALDENVALAGVSSARVLMEQRKRHEEASDEQ
jgi:hypothetical protein